MSEPDSTSDIIALEVFLFQGAPERPNPVYGRDTFANVDVRQTGSVVSNPVISLNAAKGTDRILLQEIRADLDSGIVKFGSFHGD